jgi:hypothetical protein
LPAVGFGIVRLSPFRPRQPFFFLREEFLMEKTRTDVNSNHPVCGAALWGNLVVTASNSPGRVIASNKETGKIVWETTFPEMASVVITTAPLAIKDKISSALPIAARGCATGSLRSMPPPARGSG